MPTYEYECQACGHTFEEFQSISAKPLRTCPQCRRRRLRRLIGTGAALLFRGSGFYATDYRSKDYREKAKSESSSASGGESAKSESKPSESKSSSSKASSGGKDSK